MLQDASSRHISETISAAAGDTVLIPANPDAWNYIHELIGDLDGAGSIEILAIDADSTEHSLGMFNLDVGQGITLQDEPGQDNRPRFEFNPGQDAVLRVASASFTGGLDRSVRY